MLTKKFIAAALAISVFIFAPPLDGTNFFPTAQAEIKTYAGTGKGIQCDLITIEKAREYARLRAEINAKDQAGVYLRGYTKMQNFNLTENKIEVITNSIVNIVGEVKYSMEPFEYGGVPAVLHTATLQANIDTDGINAYINREDKGEIQSARKEIIENLDKIENLIERYNRATTQAEKDKIRAELSDADKKVLAGQKNNEGVKLFTKGKYKEAIEKFNESIKFNPNHPVTYFNRGRVYSELKNREYAISDLNKVIELNPNDVRAYYNRGYIYAELKQYDKAFADLNKSIQLDPNNYKAYNYRAAAYVLVENLEQAIIDYSHAIELNSRDLDSYKSRGVLYLHLKNYKKALYDFTKYIELDPYNAEAYKLRGLAFTLSNNFKQAIDDYTEILKLNPNNAQAYYFRGICYERLYENEKAAADFAKAKELGYTE